ncbi:MAG TPA: carbohydrate porin [Pyrinomonadaceae bacterium]
MFDRVRSIVFVTLTLLTLLLTSSLVAGQEPSASPASTPTVEQVQNDAKAGVASTGDPAPAPDFWRQQTMTGDWGGTRSRWKEKGIDLEFKLSNFFQGTTAGGARHDFEYNGKFEMWWKFDLGKVAGWKYWSSEIKTEYRFGGPVLGGTGGLNPTNTAALVPAADGQAVTVSALNFTRIIPKDLQKGDLYVVSFGRYNLLDLLDEDFFAGAGTDRFFNMAQIGPLTVLRQVPLITNAATFAYVKHGEPFVTFAVLDPNDHSFDPGLDDLLADGVTFNPGINFSAKYFGKSAKHSFSGAITTKKYTPFDAIKQVIIPGPPLNPVEPKRGSWSVSYIFRQYLVERAHRDGWGVFSQVAFADRDTSPMTRFVNVGLGGNGLFKSRRQDEFGVAYAYSDLSKVLKDNINLITIGDRTLQAEHQVEMFYNLHITPWLQLTGDLQIIRGVRPAFERAVVPGGRLVMIF